MISSQVQTGAAPQKGRPFYLGEVYAVVGNTEGPRHTFTGSLALPSTFPSAIRLVPVHVFDKTVWLQVCYITISGIADSV